MKSQNDLELEIKMLYRKIYFLKTARDVALVGFLFMSVIALIGVVT